MATAPSAPLLQDPRSHARARTRQLHNSSIHKVAVSSSLGHARQFPWGHVPTMRCCTIPEMWLADNRRKSGLFPGAGSCGSHETPCTHPGKFPCSRRPQGSGRGTEARLWQGWSRRPCSERGGRVEEHKVNLGVSHCHSTTIREHPAGCQRSRGTSMEQALADAARGAALSLLQSDAVDFAGQGSLCK